MRDFEPSKKAWGTPLPLEGLRSFRHPNPGHVFGAAVWHEGEALASNGLVALRATKGWWGPEDFEQASEGFLERFFGIPWGGMPAGNEWSNLDDVRGTLYRGHPGVMYDKGRDGWRFADCCKVRVGGSVVVPLSVLQWVARLPRCEVWTGLGDGDQPLAFRFSGGVGMIAPDASALVDFAIFEPRRHDDGSRIARSGPRPGFSLPGWPPVDKTDDSIIEP